MKAVRVHEYGGPEVIRYEDVPLPEPGPGEARVRIEASGVNFIDVYHRTGLYKGPLPVTLGSEAAGVVDTVAPDVTDVAPGQRVAYAMHFPGGYAEFAVVPAWKLVALPDAVETRTASAVMLQGATAHYLTHSSYPLRAGETALIHAAAGGMGQLLVQVAKRLGARVIATVSTEQKARTAREVGADDVILYTQEDFVEAVRRLTGGRGVDVVYDGVGKTTAEKGLDCLRPRGYLVLFGNASGPPPAFDPLTLMSKGSLFLTRPTLGHHLTTREEVLWRCGTVLDWVASGDLKARIAQTFPLAAAADAHRALEGRGVIGKIVLLP